MSLAQKLHAMQAAIDELRARVDALESAELATAGQAHSLPNTIDLTQTIAFSDTMPAPRKKRGRPPKA